MGKLPRKYYAALVVLLALAVAAIFFARVPSGVPEGLIQANGRIEGDLVSVASKVPGRIVRIDVREGDSVKEGQVLARLDDAQLRARVEQAAAAVATLEAQLASADSALDLLRNEVPVRVHASTAEVGRAQALMAKAEANGRQARREAGRAESLAAQGFASKQLGERARLVSDVAASELTAAREGLVQSRRQLDLARLGDHQIRARESERGALQAQLRQAQASLAEVESLLADLTITARSAGVVVTRVREPGEVIASGAPILELVDLEKLYLKVFVAESEIGKLRRDLPARIYTDAFPDQPFAARVRYIASRAEFTPKEVQTPDERVKLVYAVKLYLDANPGGRLTPGLPADAMIRWREGAPWAKPRW